MTPKLALTNFAYNYNILLSKGKVFLVIFLIFICYDFNTDKIRMKFIQNPQFISPPAVLTASQARALRLFSAKFKVERLSLAYLLQTLNLSYRRRQNIRPLHFGVYVYSASQIKRSPRYSRRPLNSILRRKSPYRTKPILQAAYAPKYNRRAVAFIEQIQSGQAGPVRQY